MLTPLEAVLCFIRASDVGRQQASVLVYKTACPSPQTCLVATNQLPVAYNKQINAHLYFPQLEANFKISKESKNVQAGNPPIVEDLGGGEQG